MSYLPSMKLKQGQVWKLEDKFVRVVGLERLSVRYKLMTDLTAREGTHHQLTKKEFCRLIKKASLVETITEPPVKEKLPIKPLQPSS